MDLNFDIRVLGTTAMGIPALTYSVAGGVTDEALTPNNTLSGNGTGNQDFQFTIPAANVVGDITLSAIAGVRLRADYGLVGGFATINGLARIQRLGSWTGTGTIGTTALTAATMPRAVEGLPVHFGIRTESGAANTWLADGAIVTFTVGGVAHQVRGVRQAADSDRSLQVTIPGDSRVPTRLLSP
jgi:hypothetical protein